MRNYFKLKAKKNQKYYLKYFIKSTLFLILIFALIQHNIVISQDSTSTVDPFCEKYFNNPDFTDKTIKTNCNKLMSRTKPEMAKELCNEQFELNPALLTNKKAREFANLIGIQSMIGAGSNSAAGTMALGQAGNYNDLINKFKLAGSPVPTAGPMNQDAMKTECDLNPDLPKCKLKLGEGGGFTFGNNGDLTINPNSAGTYVEGLNAGSGSDGTNGIGTAGGSADATKVGGAVGDKMGLNGLKGGGNFESRVGAANVKSKAPGGGGGGGGGIPGASAPNVGGGGDNKQQPPNPSNGSSSLAYKEGKGGIGFQGAGTGTAKGKGDGSDNPFDKLFGKKDGTGQGETLNFRELASKGRIGDTSTDIFKRLSDRYQNVYQNKRMEVYEEVASSPKE